jgi:hypothetical protein
MACIDAEVRAAFCRDCWTLYDLNSAQVARSLPTTDPRRSHFLPLRKFTIPAAERPRDERKVAMDGISGLIGAGMAIAAVVAASRVARPGERFAVYRLGKFHRTIGPGWVLIVPFVDRVVRYRSDRDVPDWSAMSYDQAKSIAGLPGARTD